MASTPELFSSTNNSLLYSNYYSEQSELTVPPSASEFCDRCATRSNICTEEGLMLPCNLNDFCLLEGFLSSSSSSSEKLETISCDDVVPSFSSNEYHSYISGDHNSNNISLNGGNFQETVYNNTNNNSNIVPLDNNILHKLFSGEDYYCSASTPFSPEFKPLSRVAGEQNKWGIQSNQLNGIIEVKVGRYSEEERKERIVRYLKKRNQRNFNKTIKYACRKTLADRRVRVRGRFARNNNELYHHHDDQQIEPEKINVDDQDRKDVKISCDDGLQVVNDEDWLQNFAYCVAGLMEDQLFN